MNGNLNNKRNQLCEELEEEGYRQREPPVQSLDTRANLGFLRQVWKPVQLVKVAGQGGEKWAVWAQSVNLSCV